MTIHMIGKKPNAAPSPPESSGLADRHRVDDRCATMIATASEMSAAHCAFILNPPSSTNSVNSGSTAKIDDQPERIATGSKTCLYIGLSSLVPCCRGLPDAVGCGNSFALVRVALFVTCLGDTLFPHTGQAVVRLLERLGVRGGVPGGADLLRPDAPEQRLRATRVWRWRGGCAGVRRVRRRWCRPSASCAGMVREQLWREIALARARAVRVPRGRLGVEDVGAYYPHRVTYHPTCHSLRALRLGDAPLRLLRAVRGSTSSSCPTREECCGFGGTFAVKNADVSSAMLTDKMRARARHGAEVVHRGRQLVPDAHRRRPLARRAGVRTVHLAEILASTEADYGGLT